ncbi:type II secretion system F family protein, partial [Cellulomonas sp. HZM]|uniref:type II secretion system F family protein n=1 Tax=Cellulomonas sp. HZM TaxID=1454010 RepID=UPI0004937B77
MSAVVAAVLVAAVLPWTSGRRPRGTPRARDEVHGPVDEVLLLDVLDAALSSGAPVPRALQVVGACVGGDDGAALARAAGALVLGASWDRAWAGSTSACAALADALEPAWTSGVSPGPLLRAEADRLRRERRTAARAAAATLGVRLVLPLGLCFLPAFVLLGLVPMVVSLASGLVR